MGIDPQVTQLVTPSSKKEEDLASNIDTDRLMSDALKGKLQLNPEEQKQAQAIVNNEEGLNKMIEFNIQNGPFGGMIKSLFGEDQTKKLMGDMAKQMLSGQGLSFPKGQQATATKATDKPPTKSKIPDIEKMKNDMKQEQQEEAPVPPPKPLPSALPDPMTLLEQVASSVPDLVQSMKFDDLTQEDLDEINDELENEVSDEDAKKKALIIPNMFTNNMLALLNFFKEKLPKSADMYENHKQLILEVVKQDPLEPINKWGECIKGHDHVFRACTPENIDELRRHAESDFFLMMLMFKQNWPILAENKQNIQELWKIFGGMMQTYDLYVEFPTGMGAMMMDFAQNIGSKAKNDPSKIGSALQSCVQELANNGTFKKDAIKLAMQFKRSGGLGDEKADEYMNAISVNRPAMP